MIVIADFSDTNFGEFVAQSDKLAGFLIALYQNDHSLLRQSLADVLVEPKRAPLIPGFYAVKQAALDAGAIGASRKRSAIGLRAGENVVTVRRVAKSADDLALLVQ